MVDGEKQYDQVDENGIEIFHTVEGPPDQSPEHAEFPINKRLGTAFLNVRCCARSLSSSHSLPSHSLRAPSHSPSHLPSHSPSHWLRPHSLRAPTAARWQVDDCFKAVKSMIEHMPGMFGPNALEPWERFKREHPRKLADVPNGALPQWQLPPLLIADAPLPKPLFEQLKEYKETIQYTNPTSKTIYTNHKSRGQVGVDANLVNERIPEPVRKGEILFVDNDGVDNVTLNSNQVSPDAQTM